MCWKWNSKSGASNFVSWKNTGRLSQWPFCKNTNDAIKLKNCCPGSRVLLLYLECCFWFPQELTEHIWTHIHTCLSSRQNWLQCLIRLNFWSEYLIITWRLPTWDGSSMVNGKVNSNKDVLYLLFFSCLTFLFTSVLLSYLSNDESTCKSPPKWPLSYLT